MCVSNCPDTLGVLDRDNQTIMKFEKYAFFKGNYRIFTLSLEFITIVIYCLPVKQKESFLLNTGMAYN